MNFVANYHDLYDTTVCFGILITWLIGKYKGHGCYH